MNVPCRKEVYVKLKKWTETTIKQAFDDFVRQHDRLPTKHEMYEIYNGDFPRTLTVKRNLGVTLNEYLKENYSKFFRRRQSKIYGLMPDEYWIEDFKKQYIEYGRPTEAVYDKARRPGTPNTQTLAKIMGVTTWREILDCCDLVEKIELKGELVFEETLENYLSLNEKLQKFIKNLK